MIQSFYIFHRCRSRIATGADIIESIDSQLMQILFPNIDFTQPLWNANLKDNFRTASIAAHIPSSMLIPSVITPIAFAIWTYLGAAGDVGLYSIT